MGRGEAPKLQVRCEDCGSAFLLTLKRGRLPASEIPCPKCKTPLDIESQWEEHKKKHSFRERPNTDNRKTALSPLHQRDSLASDAFVKAKFESKDLPAGSGDPVPRARILSHKRIRRDFESGPATDDEPSAQPGSSARVIADESKPFIRVDEHPEDDDPTIDSSLEDLLDFGDDVEDIEIGDLSDVEEVPDADAPQRAPESGVDQSDDESEAHPKRTAKLNAVKSGGPKTLPIPKVDSKSENKPGIPSLKLPKPNFKEARKQAREDAQEEAVTLEVDMNDAISSLRPEESESFQKASENFLSGTSDVDPDDAQTSPSEPTQTIEAEDPGNDSALSDDRPKIEIATEYEHEAQELATNEANRREESARSKTYEESAEIAIYEDTPPRRSDHHVLILMLILAAACVIGIVIWLI